VAALVEAPSAAKTSPEVHETGQNSGSPAVASTVVEPIEFPRLTLASVPAVTVSEGARMATLFVWLQAVRSSARLGAQVLRFGERSRWRLGRVLQACAHAVGDPVDLEKVLSDRCRPFTLFAASLVQASKRCSRDMANVSALALFDLVEDQVWRWPPGFLWRPWSVGNLVALYRSSVERELMEGSFALLPDEGGS